MVQRFYRRSIPQVSKKVSKNFSFLSLLLFIHSGKLFSKRVQEQSPLFTGGNSEEIFLPVEGFTPGEGFGALFTKMLAVLAALLLFLYLAAWCLKQASQLRWRKEQSSSAIDVLEKRALHPKALLYLIQVEDQKILAVESAAGITSLAQWKKSEEQTPLHKMPEKTLPEKALDENE